MKIGVDIDGVLTEQVHVLWEMGLKFCTEKGWECRLDPTAVSKEKMFGISDEGWLELWCKYAKSWMLDLPMRNCAAEVIRKLRAEGHEIWIITARSEADPHFVGMREDETLPEATEKWLAENGISYDQITFEMRAKGQFCRENGVEMMIEDDPRMLASFDGDQKILVFDQPYNQTVKIENGARVYAWYDVYDKIQKMAGEIEGREGIA